jgi:hypothetical protein
VSVLDAPAFHEFVVRVKDFIDEYAWHSRLCAAIDADGEWRTGNPACDCGYDEAFAALVPPEPARG